MAMRVTTIIKGRVAFHDGTSSCLEWLGLRRINTMLGAIARDDLTPTGMKVDHPTYPTW